MILQELMGRHDPASVVDRLAEIYPAEVDNKDKYLVQYLKCLHLDPVASEFTIVVREYPDGDETVYDVGAITGETKREYFLRDNPGKSVSDPTHSSWDALESFSLGLTAWNEWVAMPVHQDAFLKYSEVDIIAHILWEMSWHSFDEIKIQGVVEDLKEALKDVKNGTAKLTSFEDLFKGPSEGSRD